MANFFRIGKMLVLGLILFLIYYQLTSGDGINAILNVWTSSKKDINLIFLFFCILLMPVNWWLESIKWRLLMSPHDTLSRIQSIKTILAGITLGIVTPARLGEYGGRLLTSDPLKKTQVISATLLGSIAQNLCNVLAGLAFSYYFLKSVFSVTYGSTFTFMLLIIVQIIIFTLVYYNLPEVAHYIEKKIGVKYTGRYSARLKSLDLYKSPLLHKVLFISLLRYITYFSQYVLMLKFLGIHADILDVTANITGIYLIQTGIPLPAFLSVFARGELAVLVWAGIGVDQITALAATFGLWFINLILPSLAGTLILYETDIKKYFKTMS
ncbi:MAG: flippase-like domain-containing protein [Saprospiraceae bacterium]|nr:flippase-like domain-containing protein [Saprospiraceae bacterium]